MPQLQDIMVQENGWGGRRPSKNSTMLDNGTVRPNKNLMCTPPSLKSSTLMATGEYILENLLYILSRGKRIVK